MLSHKEKVAIIIKSLESIAIVLKQFDNQKWYINDKLATTFNYSFWASTSLHV